MTHIQEARSELAAIPADEVKAALGRLLDALPHIQLAISIAKVDSPNADVRLGILAKNPDGSGRIAASFEEAFLHDLQLVLAGVPHKGSVLVLNHVEDLNDRIFQLESQLEELRGKQGIP